MPQGILIPEAQPSPDLFTGVPSQWRASREKGDPSTALSKDSIHMAERDGTIYLVSENYSYKSEAYYSILEREIRGQRVAPDSSSILDAFVVPICLERAHSCGIPVADYAISQSCIPVPAVIYGLNYFACTSHFEVLQENAHEREMIRHVTNNGKYPFCSQRLDEGVRIERKTSIFGMVASPGKGMADMAGRIWECFRIPLVEIVCLSGPDGLRLSSLCPVRYSHLPKVEKAILRACLSGQEFL